METLSLRCCLYCYCRLQFVFSISTHSECNKRGQTSRPVVRAEIQTSCNFKAIISDCSDLLDCVRCFFDIVPFKSTYTYLVWLYSYSFMSCNFNYNFLKLRHHQTQVQGHIQQEQPSQLVPLNIERYRKAVSSAMWVQCTLVACYLPFPIARALIGYSTSSSSSSPIFDVAVTLIYLNSSLNPFLYCWKINEVKQAVN